MRNRKYYKYLILNFLLLCQLPNAMANTLSGVVLQNDRPISGMEIHVSHPDTETFEEYTNGEGEYEFKYLPVNGRYDVELFWRGRSVHQESFTFSGNTKFNINLE